MNTKCFTCHRIVSKKSKECPYCHENFISDKRILPAFILCFFFGWFGVHRFYVGKIGTGLLLLALGIAGFSQRGAWALALLWTVIDFITIIVGAFTDKQGRRVELWT